MEKARVGIIGSIIDFINSFSNLGSVNDGKVRVEDLDKEDKKELDRVLKASGENVKKIEDSMSKYKANVNIDKAKKAAAIRNNKNVEKEDKTRGNN